MMYVVKLKNSILGWMLIPTNEDSKTILNQLYMFDYNSAAKPSDLAFMKGEPINEVLQNIRTVCKQMDISVSFCGSKSNPTIRLWWTPVKPIIPQEINVDLKWSCWSVEYNTWEYYAPEVWVKMHDAWSGKTDPVKINTSPFKEIRYGSVVIGKKQANGYFCTGWDDVSSLADTLDTIDYQILAEMIPFSEHNMEPGVDWEFSVKSKSFSKLMKMIDKEESKLLKKDKSEWDFIKSCFEKKQ